MRTILNIAYAGQAWGGFMSSYAETTYPKVDLTTEEAIALRDDLLASRNGKVDGKIDIVGLGGDFQSLIDMAIEQRTVEFHESVTEDGRRVAVEITRTEVLANWLRPESESLMDDEEFDEGDLDAVIAGAESRG